MNQKQNEALLFVARETKMISINDVAKMVLENAGFTPAEIASVFSVRAPKKNQTKTVRSAGKRGRGKRAANASALWTDIDDAAIIAMWADGRTVPQMAKALKRTASSVNARVASLRTAGKHLPIRNAGASEARRKRTAKK